jgi:hypothetical protein
MSDVNVVPKLAGTVLSGGIVKYFYLFVCGFMAVSRKAEVTAGTATVLPKLRPQEITAVHCCPVVVSEFALLLSSWVLWVVTAYSSGRGQERVHGSRGRAAVGRRYQATR